MSLDVESKESTRMSEKITEGSNSFLVRTLVDVTGPRLSDRDLDDLMKEFVDRVAVSQEAKKNPKYNRHAAEIAERYRSYLKKPFEKEELPAMSAFVSGIVSDVSMDEDYFVPKATAGTVQSTLTSILEPESVDSDMHRAEQTELLKMLNDAAREYERTRAHPFVKRVRHAFDYGRCGSSTTYLIVGTSTGVTRNGWFNTNCTSGNARKIKDSDLVVQKCGRAMSACFENNEGHRYFVWLLHHNPGTQVRFWINTAGPGGVRADHPAGNRRIVMDQSERGWQEA